MEVQLVNTSWHQAPWWNLKLLFLCWGITSANLLVLHASEKTKALMIMQSYAMAITVKERTLVSCDSTQCETGNWLYTVLQFNVAILKFPAFFSNLPTVFPFHVCSSNPIIHQDVCVLLILPSHACTNWIAPPLAAVPRAGRSHVLNSSPHNLSS